jgi:hypothetical protein
LEKDILHNILCALGVYEEPLSETKGLPAMAMVNLREGALLPPSNGDDQNCIAVFFVKVLHRCCPFPMPTLDETF